MCKLCSLLGLFGKKEGNDVDERSHQDNESDCPRRKKTKESHCNCFFEKSLPPSFLPSSFVPAKTNRSNVKRLMPLLTKTQTSTVYDMLLLTGKNHCTNVPRATKCLWTRRFAMKILWFLVGTKQLCFSANEAFLISNSSELRNQELLDAS